MAAASKPTPPKDEQLELEFPDPSEFPSYDEVQSEDGQSELPEDSFDEAGVTEGEDNEGCCVR